jgi:hypothetical protein
VAHSFEPGCLRPSGLALHPVPGPGVRFEYGLRFAPHNRSDGLCAVPGSGSLPVFGLFDLPADDSHGIVLQGIPPETIPSIALAL